MLFGWKKISKIISSLVVFTFLSSAILPVAVIAGDVEKQVDSSITNESKSSDSPISSPNSDLLLDSEAGVSTTELFEKDYEVIEENVEVINKEIEKIDSEVHEEDENKSIFPIDPNEKKTNLTEDENIKNSEKNSVVEEEQPIVEQQKEEDFEEIFSLEDNRAEAMEVLSSLPNANSRMMMASSLHYTTEFIYNLAQSAVQMGNENGLYPSVMMAQAILETGWGKSTLSKTPNHNLFGIKGSYNGNSVKMKTSEYSKDNEIYYIYDYFKKYPSYKESFQDYAAFIRNTKGKVRYKNVWRENAPTYKHATAGLVTGGYATDPSYNTLLNTIISKNNLDKYDSCPTVSYSTHIQSKGWLPTVSNGKGSGTTKQNKRMEAVKITVPNFTDLGIQYSTHIQKNGWMNWVSNGTVSGTSSENKRMEAIKIKLTGLQANTFDVYYRVHAQSYGWLDWAKNGAEAGTAGFGKRLEALEVKIVPKGASAPGKTGSAYIEKAPNVYYTSHVQQSGWQKTALNGNTSGTIGASKRLEAIKIGINGLSTSGGIQYRSHIQNYGWENWAANEVLSGTSGKAKRLEAIQINLTGAIKDKYDIYYRVHAQSYGWLGWAKNGQSAGTERKAKRLEGIQIRIVKKNGAAPGTTVKPFVK